MVRSLLESPLFREVLANALVAAAGAAAATLVRNRPDSAARVSKVAAAASALKGAPSRREVAEFGKQAVRELVSEVGREVIPGLMTAVAGGDSGSAKPAAADKSDGAGQRRSASKASATGWR